MLKKISKTPTILRGQIAFRNFTAMLCVCALCFLACDTYAERDTASLYYEYQEIAMSGKPMDDAARLDWAKRLEASAGKVENIALASRMRGEAGALYRSVGELERATTVYEKMLSAAEKAQNYSCKIDALENLMSSANITHGFTQPTLDACIVLETALQNPPAEGRAYFDEKLVNLYQEMGFKAHAIAKFSKNPDAKAHYLDLSLKYYSTYADSISQESPDFYHAQYAMAEIYRAMGEYAKEGDILMELYEQGQPAKMSPSSVFLQAITARYGKLSPTYQRELERYLAQAEPDERTPIARWHLAESYMRSGDYKKAIVLFEQLLEVDVVGLGSLEHKLFTLVSALLGDGQRKRARELLEEIARDFPDSPYANLARINLQRMQEADELAARKQKEQCSETTQSPDSAKTPAASPTDSKSPHLASTLPKPESKPAAQTTTVALEMPKKKEATPDYTLAAFALGGLMIFLLTFFAYSQIQKNTPQRKRR